MIFQWLVIAAMLFSKFHAGCWHKKVTTRFLATSIETANKICLRPGFHHSHENRRTCLGLGLKLDFIAVNILIPSISCKISLLAVIANI